MRVISGKWEDKRRLEGIHTRVDVESSSQEVDVPLESEAAEPRPGLVNPWSRALPRGKEAEKEKEEGRKVGLWRTQLAARDRQTRSRGREATRVLARLSFHDTVHRL